jgi:hypothetical protein
MTEPRGIRANNPTNVEYRPNTQWQGLADPPTEGRFCRFIAPQWGLRATITIMRNKQKRGLVTLLQMISDFAPAEDNNHPLSYATAVARRMGCGVHDRVDLADKDKTIAMLHGMVAVECGPAPKGTANGDWLDDSVYEAAWSLAKPLTQSRTARGSMITLISATAGAVVEVAQDIVPQAADAATLVTPIWPQIARWVLIAVCIAGGALAFYARWQAKQEGIR